MTQLSQHSVVCILCGTATELEIIESTYTLASPDLDFRPAEKTRSTLPQQIQECPHCHYCAPDLSSLPRTRAALIDMPHESGIYEEMNNILITPRYRQQLRNTDLPVLANRFLCSSIISEVLTDYTVAFWDVMRAAWACDDAEAPEAALKCRDEALQLVDGLRRQGRRFFSEHGLQEQILIDIYRRMGRFKAAQILNNRILSSIKPPAADMVTNLRFEQSLIEAADSATHNYDAAVESGLGEPLFESDPAEQDIVERVLAEVDRVWSEALSAALGETPACLYAVQTANADWARLLCLPPAGRVWLYDRQRRQVPISHRAVPRGFYITGDDFTEGMMGHLGRSWMSPSSGPFHPFGCFKFHVSPERDQVLINYVLGPLWGSGWVGKVLPGDPVRLEKDESFGEWAA